ncbi:MAG TPA: HD domain-containing phosphohydrolase, partial [Vicinamibacteria bacterium]|nr:HD domain-containing phosphohydrolase [Vicinamibacteria bacterium]
ELAYDVFEFFEERGMGGFVIDGSLDSEAVRELLRLLVYAAPAQRRFAALDSALRQSGLCFRINKTLAGAARSSAEVALERRAYAFLTYSKLVVLYRGLLAEDRPSPHRRQFLMKKIARTVQALVDICMEDDHTFLGVASVKSGEGYAAHHAANTAVLSIALGEKLGLDKVQLADLGLAAVFSDVGLRQVPPSILDKTAPLTPEERALLDTHPLRSVEFLLGEGVFSKSVLARIVVAFEHHQCPDGSGYPAHSRAPDIFSRMVSIAEEYDALTTERPWRRALLPDEALGAMLAGSVRRFDGALLKVFANTIGLYPVGTLVRLTTGALAVVVYGGGDGERATRPIVAPLGPDGRPSGTLDLITRDVSGAYVAGVVSAEDPVRYGLQPSALFALSAPV